MSSPRAILLRGAAAASPTYFTLLPDSFAELLNKARTLFPAPPASPSTSAAARVEPEARLTLGSDASAILCADALPALRERELLVLRWSVPASAAPPAVAAPAASPSPALKSSLRVRWDASIPPPAQQAGPSSDAAAAAPTSVAQLRQAAGTKARLRAEHARRVLEEQRVLRVREAEQQAGDGEPSASTASVGQSEETSECAEPPSPVVSALESAAAGVTASEAPAAAVNNAVQPPLSPSSSTTASPVVQETASPVKPASATASPALASPSTASQPEQQFASASTTLDLPQPAEDSSSPPPYSSPRVPVPIATSSDAQEMDIDTQQGSSPPTSPTRNVQSALLKPLASNALELGAATRRGDASDRMSMAYRSMTAVLEALRHHPGNLYFRHALPASFVHFSQKHCGQHVDFAVLASRIAARAYHDAAGPSAGAASDVAEAREALMRFKTDLTQLWRNAAAFFGSKSKEAVCADTLRRFAEIVFEEWSRRLGAQPAAAGATSSEAEKPAAVRREGADDAQRTPQAQRFFRALSGAGAPGARAPAPSQAQRSFLASKRLPQQAPPHPRKRLGPPLALHSQAPASASAKRGEPTAEQYAAFLSAVSAPSTRAAAPRGLDLPARDDASRMGSADVRTPTYESVLEVPQMPPQPKPQQAQPQEKAVPQPQPQSEAAKQPQLVPRPMLAAESRKHKALPRANRRTRGTTRSLAVALGNSSAEEEESSQSSNELSDTPASGSRRASPTLALAAAVPRRSSGRAAHDAITIESDGSDDDASFVEALVFGAAAAPALPSTPRFKRKARTSLGAGAYAEPSSSDFDGDSLSEAEPEQDDVQEAEESVEEREEPPRPTRPAKRFRSKLAALAAAAAAPQKQQEEFQPKRSARMIARRQRGVRA